MTFNEGSIVKVVYGNDEIYEGRIFGVLLQECEDHKLHTYINLHNFADGNQLSLWVEKCKSIELINENQNIIENFIKEINQDNARINKIEITYLENRWYIFFMRYNGVGGAIDLCNITQWELIKGFNYCYTHNIRITVNKNQNKRIDISKK